MKLNRLLVPNYDYYQIKNFLSDKTAGLPIFYFVSIVVMTVLISTWIINYSVFGLSSTQSSNIVISGGQDYSTVINSVTSNDISGKNIDKQMNGKIATSKFDLQNGKVEIIFFGDWSLDAKGKGDITFSSDLVMKNVDKGTQSKYHLGDFKVTSYQKINGNYYLNGKLDITGIDPSGKKWNNISTIISIPKDNKVIVISFKDTALPLIGVVTSS